MALDTVSVGCKIPGGVVLHLRDQSGDLREVKLRGTAQRPGQMRPYIVAGEERATKVEDGEQTYLIGSAAITEVPADFWAAWEPLYKKWPPYATGAIFMRPKKDDAIAVAKERRSLMTGLEPIDPANPAPKVTPLKED